MLKATKKRFDIKIVQANSTVRDTFELDKNIVKVNGVLVTSDKDDLLYYRGTQKIEINKEEFFPDNYESKLLMSGINVSPKQRYYDLGGASTGNGRVQITYKDLDDGRTVFSPYRVSLYLDCEIKDELK
jgi:YbbR domain-containing protein